jgi:hypothetical protein
MFGPAIIIVILVVAIPVSVIMTGALIAAALGWFLRTDVETTHEGSELLDLNV